MDPSPDRIAAFSSRWVETQGNKGAVGELAERLANGELETVRYADIISRHGSVNDDWIRTGLIDLIIEFASDRLNDGPLTRADIEDIRRLRSLLHIRDDEVIRKRPVEVSAIVQSALENVLLDGVIDNDEDIYLVELQAAFGVGYDHLMMAARPAFERAMARLTDELRRARDAGDHRLAAVKIAALEPIYRLAKLHRRSLGALY